MAEGNSPGPEASTQPALVIEVPKINAYGEIETPKTNFKASASQEPEIDPDNLPENENAMPSERIAALKERLAHAVPVEVDASGKMHEVTPQSTAPPEALK